MADEIKCRKKDGEGKCAAGKDEGGKKKYDKECAADGGGGGSQISFCCGESLEDNRLVSKYYKTVLTGNIYKLLNRFLYKKVLYCWYL